MSDLIVLGTDTDAGKTTFAVLWLAAYGDDYGYWKPVETGESDTGRVRQLLPRVTAWEPVGRYTAPVAPPLAARREGRSIPSAAELARARPATNRPLLIETFGGPLSPLNESELQITIIRLLPGRSVLVASPALGAIGRTLAALQVLQAAACDVAVVVLIGSADPYAEAEIQKYGHVPVVGLRAPDRWDPAGVAAAAGGQRETLELVRSYVSPTPRAVSDDLIRRDRAAVWHPYTALAAPEDPLPVVGAEAEYVELADGRRLIDGISSWWTILHGHRHPRLMDALGRASQRVDHVLFAGVTHPAAVECAEELLKTVPWSGGRVFFSDNGSTAVEVALKMAYQVWCHRGEPGRTVFVGLENGYHGDTFGAMAVGRDPVFFGRFEPLLFRAERVPVSPERLDELLSRRAAEVAAVIAEPLVQGAGGMRMHSADTLRDLHAVARRHGVLFVADEVMTAGRTGTFWAHTQSGIAPDLICAAKTLAGGVMPLAVTLVSPEIVSAFDTADRERTFFHGHSFTAHPLACAVAAENLRMMAEGEWLRRSEHIHRVWTTSVAELAGLPGVTDVRVCGTILALDVGSGGYLADSGRPMRAAAVDAGVLLRPLGNVLYAMPPLNTSDDCLRRILDAMRTAVLAAGA